MPRNIKLLLEYDGTDFHGWQAQETAGAGAAPGEVRTVQGEVERALRELTGTAIAVAGASRTDAGVHAAGQVASLVLPDGVRLPAAAVAPALNARLPEDVSVLSSAEAPPDFHARYSARGKVYRYSILERSTRPALLRRTHWQMRCELDVERMRAAAGCLLGLHDFAAFVVQLATQQEVRAGSGRPALGTVREMRRVEIEEQPFSARIVPDTDASLRRRDHSVAPAPSSPEDAPATSCLGREVLIEFEGTGFLYRMVRTLVGSLVEVGRGRHPPEWLAEVLASRDRRRAGVTAPAQGLTLVRVIY